MKRFSLFLLSVLFTFSIGKSQSFIEVAGNYGLTESDFDKTFGFELAYNYPLTERLLFSPVGGFQFLKINKTTEAGGAIVSQQATDTYASFGTGIYYNIFQGENYHLSLGPKVSVLYFPKQTGFFGNNVLTPNEWRYYGSVAANFVDKVSDNIGFKVGLEFGYLTKSKLTEGKDYVNDYWGRPYEAFTANGIHIGVLVFLN